MIGFTPRDVDEMTLWEFTACIAGYAKAHGVKDSRPISDAEYDALEALGEQWNMEALNGG